MPVESLTLDTNLPLAYWQKEPKRGVVEQILKLGADGRVSLAVTARIREDVPRPPLSAQIEELSDLGVEETGTPIRMGFWVMGRDMIASDEFLSASEKISTEMRRQGKTPPDWRDWDHLHAHYLHRRDVFLTWDDMMLRAGEELFRVFGIVVMTPEAYLEKRTSPGNTPPTLPTPVS